MPLFQTIQPNKFLIFYVSFLIFKFSTNFFNIAFSTIKINGNFSIFITKFHFIWLKNLPSMILNFRLFILFYLTKSKKNGTID